MNKTHSAALLSRAKAALPMGTSSPLRACRNVAFDPLFCASAQGETITDADGRDYVDFVYGFGPVILGHAHPAIVEAVCDQVRKGTVMATCHPLEVDLAETLLSRCTGMAQLRFLSSGTEAVMTALRLGRAASGKLGILRMDGGYHGHSDLAQQTTDATTRGLNPKEMKHISQIPAGDIDALEAHFATAADTLGVVIIEPVLCNNSLREIPVPFLQRLRELCSEHNVVLIFDEVITGYRFRYGPISDALGVVPDIVTFGKIIGGGLPVGAVAGRGPIMDLLEAQTVYQGGTFSGNPVTMAAGLAAMAVLRTGEPYLQIDRLAAPLHRFARGLETSDRSMRLSIMSGVFSIDFVAPGADRTADYAALYGFARVNGVHLAPNVDEVMYVSAASTEGGVQKLIDVLDTFAARAKPASATAGAL